MHLKYIYGHKIANNVLSISVPYNIKQVEGVHVLLCEKTPLGKQGGLRISTYERYRLLT